MDKYGECKKKSLSYIYLKIAISFKINVFCVSVAKPIESFTQN